MLISQKGDMSVGKLGAKVSHFESLYSPSH